MDVAKQVIHRAPLDANTVAMLQVVLDDVWSLVEQRFAGHPARAHVPTTIANALLDLAAAGERNPAALGAAALTLALELA